MSGSQGSPKVEPTLIPTQGRPTSTKEAINQEISRKPRRGRGVTRRVRVKVSG